MTTEKRYLLDVDAAVLAMEMAGRTVPTWMNLRELPSHLPLTEGKHRLAMDLVESELPVELLDEIQIALTGDGQHVPDDPPFGFTLDAVLFYAAHGALIEAVDVAA
ncbi:MAG TPA: hypothetical protein VJ998_10040 [Pseudomonadales bacterium]|nr:hypothetical protein [Pseudomonadales bacterium]